MPKVSVIVPVYNTELYVERAIISLMEQTLDDVQFIIIDDGSKDQSLNIIKQVIARYPARQEQVTLISRKNCGVAATRAQGMGLASGDYVIHLDSDDWAELNWLEIMYNKAIAENADVVVCDYAAVYDNKTVYIHMAAEKTGHASLKQLLSDKQRGYTWNKLISSRVINIIGETFVDGINYLEDFIYVMKCFYASDTVVYLDQCLYNYNQQNTNSITSEISPYKRECILATVDYVSDFLLQSRRGNIFFDELVNFKIRQKTFLIYSEWDSVTIQTWQLFPDVDSRVFFADIPLHFKLCMMISSLKQYSLASIAMRYIVKFKIMFLQPIVNKITYLLNSKKG